MIFTPTELDLIRARVKTEVRMPVRTLKPPLQPILEKVCPFQRGRLYKATLPPARGVRHPGIPITVDTVTSGLLGDVDRKAAIREGFKWLIEYRKHWETRYGSWTPDLPVWVIQFRVGDLRDEFDTPRLLASIGHVGHVAYETVTTGQPDGKGVHVWPSDDEHTEDYTDRPDLAMGGAADPGEGLTARQLEPYAALANGRQAVRRLVPVHGSLARITDEIAEMRSALGTGGKVDKDVHRDLVRLERARDALQRRLAS